MKFKVFIAVLAVALSCAPIERAAAQATILPPGETCFQANAGVNGMVGLLGAITGGSSYVNGTYGGVPLTGGSGSGATANITISGGIVTQVAVLNPGTQYVVGDVLSATAANIGGSGSGFSVPVASTAINSSLAGGSVGFYIPNSQTFKQTWQDSGQTIFNQNPVPLDQNGCAVIYGAGIYRQVLKDSLGNIVWDKVTASTSLVGIFWAGQANGTGNVIAITDSGFALQDGAAIQFLAKAANTGPTTISVSGGGAIAVVIDGTSGPSALTGGEIGPGNTPLVVYDATNVQFHLINPAITASTGGGTGALIPPQGYFNLVGQSTGDVVQTGDVVGTSTIFYSPFVGNTIPIWNGSVFKLITFPELVATLTASGSPANSIQDACVFSNNGTATLVIGPSWTTATAGAGNRGTGAGTAQITRLQGVWVNAVTITAYNGLSSYSIAANQCTMVGSLSIDAAPGQVSAYRNFGQSRKWGIWNFYNRQSIQLIVADPSASWTSAPATWRQSNGNSTNFALGFTGLPEENVTAAFLQTLSGSYTNVGLIANIAIGINSTTAISGMRADYGLSASAGSTSAATLAANTSLAPAVGINQFNMLEQVPAGSSAITFFGTSTLMRMTLSWRG